MNMSGLRLSNKNRKLGDKNNNETLTKSSDPNFLYNTYVINKKYKIENVTVICTVSKLALSKKLKGPKPISSMQVTVFVVFKNLNS